MCRMNFHERDSERKSNNIGIRDSSGRLIGEFLFARTKVWHHQSNCVIFTANNNMSRIYCNCICIYIVYMTFKLKSKYTGMNLFLSHSVSIFFVSSSNRFFIKTIIIVAKIASLSVLLMGTIILSSETSGDSCCVQLKKSIFKY